MSRLLDVLTQLESLEYKTSEELSLKIGVSQKTIRNDLKMLKDLGEENGFLVRSKARFGYILEVNDLEKFEIFKHSYDTPEVPVTNEDRVAFVAIELLTSERFQTLGKLADKLYVSKSTIHIIVKKVEELFNEYSLNLDKRNNRGIKVNGSEIDIRQCICDLMIRYELNKYYRKFRNEEQLNRISKELFRLLQTYDINLTEIAYYNLLLYLFIDINRIKNGKNLEGECETTTHNEEKELIEKLTDFIYRKYNINFSDKEKSVLMYKLIGIRTSTDFDLANYAIYAKEDIHQLAVDMIKLIEREFNVELSNDFELKMNLIRHLIPMNIRVRFAITTVNPLKDMIKDKYSFAYVIAEKATTLLVDKYKKKISDDEIAYLALIFSLALEKEKTQFKDKKNIVLVCGSSSGSAHLLMYKYQMEFQEYLDNISICRLADLDAIDLNEVDYIFTTVPIMKKMKVPIIQVGYFLDDTDVKKIKKVFHQNKTNILKDYYSDDQFIGNLDVSTRDEAIQVLYDLAKEKYALNKEYYDSVVTREMLAKTAFGNLVAMPHTVETISTKTFVYVAVLKKPIIWGEQKVQVLFLTNIGKMRGENLVKFYDLTMRLIMDKGLIESLIQKPTFDYFMEIISNLENTN